MSGARRNRILSVIHMLTEFLENDEDEYEEYERSASTKIKGVEKGKVRTILFIENDIIEISVFKILANTNAKFTSCFFNKISFCKFHFFFI